MNKFLPLAFVPLFLISCSFNHALDSNSGGSDSMPTEINTGKSIEYITGSNTSCGRFLKVASAKSTSELFSVSHLIDDSGMSGGNGINQKHASLNQRDTMFISNRGDTKGEIVFSFETFNRFGSVAIWNYNQISKLDCGVASFEISYSEDGYHYHSIGTHVLEKGMGIDSATSKIDGKAYLSLNGIKAKFIKINILSNYGGNQFGLSEVRFFSYVPNENESLEACSFMDANIDKNSIPSIAPSLYGLTSDSLITSNPYYQASTTTSELTYSLRGQYPLKEIVFWNYNDPSHLDYGIKEIEVSLSVDNTNYKDIGTYEIPKNKGNEGCNPSLSVQLNNASAQYVRLRFLSNYGGDRNGLGALGIFKGEGREIVYDEELTSMFSSYSSNWSGADGIFSTRLNGDQSIGGSGDTLFNFSDTYSGEINAITKKRINNSMQNQSFGCFKNDYVDFVTNEGTLPIKAEKDLSRSDADAFYWLGDSFVVGNTYYVFGLYIAKQGVLGFEQVGEDLFAFSIVNGKVDFSTFRKIYDTDTNRLSYFTNGMSIIFGSGVFENTKTSKALNPDGYIYIYGYKDLNNSTNKRSLVVCRVKEDEVEDFTKYRYFDGSGWANDISKCASLTDNGNVSCELGVCEINDPKSQYYGKLILIYQDNTNGKDVCLRTSNSPYGTFSEKEILYHCEETSLMKNITQYNAKVHSVLSDNSSLVISYNLNESVSGTNNNNCDIYHPRFLRLKL